jgi:hypothetical protein
MTTFYCVKFETPPTWRTNCSYLYPPGTQEQGDMVIPPGTGFPFRRLLRPTALRLEVFDAASTRDYRYYNNGRRTYSCVPAPNMKGFKGYQAEVFLLHVDIHYKDSFLSLWAQGLTFLLCIRKVPCSNIGRDNDCCD